MYKHLHAYYLHHRCQKVRVYISTHIYVYMHITYMYTYTCVYMCT